MTRARLDRVGVVMMSAIGNTVHVLPVLNALKRHHPSARVSWIMQPGPASLVRGHPAVDEIIPFGRTRGVRGFLELRRELARRPFDVVLDFQTYLKAGVVTALTRAPVKLGFDRARARDANWLFTTHQLAPRPPSHTQDQYFEFLDALGVPHPAVEWNLGPWDDERPWQREFYARFDRPVAPLVVGATKEETSWVAERWVPVAEALYGDFGMQPVLVGGRSPREVEAERVIVEKSRVPVVSALDSGLRRLVSILDRAALVVSLDTGPLHMARALGRPVVSLMGYNNPRRTGPYRAFEDLIVDAYGDPGEDYPISFQHRPGRMRRITPEQVIEKIALGVERYVRSTPDGQPSP